jgi:hypothetical protein
MININSCHSKLALRSLGAGGLDSESPNEVYIMEEILN